MDVKRIISFSDWLEHRSMDKSWITVAQHNVHERDGWKVDLFMTSVLATIDSDETLLTSSGWLASNIFGNVEVSEDNGEVRIKVQAEKCIGENKDVRIEPFTFLRLWNDTWPSSFEIIQNFILFYNLHFDAKDGKYVTVDDTGKTTDVIRIKNETQQQKIEIRNWFLRNYLACRGRVLVRQHDNQIHANRTLAELGIEPIRGRRMRDSNYGFEHTVIDGDWTGEGPAIGLLKGKDLVQPFDRCQDKLGWPKENSKFIIGVDDRGDDVVASYGEDDDPMVFLTPVYFERDVLKKYYDTPNYKVGLHKVSCNTWYIKKYTNKADLIRVHLGDLTHLPPAEQRHWQNHNVPPDDGDPNEQFIDSDTVVYRFRESLNTFQKGFEKQFGFRPFLSLREGDAYKEDSIRVPLNNDPGEFEGQIQNLAILLPDSINAEQLERKMDLLLSEPTWLPDSINAEQLEDLNIKYKENGKPKSISMLEDFLRCNSLPTAIISYLRMIQDLRSSGVAHRKGSKHAKNTNKYGVNEDGRMKFIRKLFVDMTSVFDDLI